MTKHTQQQAMAAAIACNPNVTVGEFATFWDVYYTAAKVNKHIIWMQECCKQIISKLPYDTVTAVMTANAKAAELSVFGTGLIEPYPEHALHTVSLPDTNAIKDAGSRSMFIKLPKKEDPEAILNTAMTILSVLGILTAIFVYVTNHM